MYNNYQIFTFWNGKDHFNSIYNYLMVCNVLDVLQHRMNTINFLVLFQDNFISMKQFSKDHLMKNDFKYFYPKHNLFASKLSNTCIMYQIKFSFYLWLWIFSKHFINSQPLKNNFRNVLGKLVWPPSSANNIMAINFMNGVIAEKS